MARVFVSHATADSEAAKAVAGLLRNAGLDVWLELFELSPGQAWLPALESALEQSTHFVVLVGPAGVQRWVEREVRYALERNTRDHSYALLPLLLGDDTREDKLPLFLRQHQAPRISDWRRPDAQVVQEVAAAILHAPPLRVNVLGPNESPFRGLRTFYAEHAHLFFGRDPEIEALRERLANGVRLLPIVGASGDGKSSIVLAGLIPSLLRGRPGTTGDWRIAVLRPAEDPLGSMARALPDLNPDLGVAARDEAIAVCLKRLRDPAEPSPLVNIFAALKLPSACRVLIVIDQFEQLFALSKARTGPQRPANTEETPESGPATGSVVRATEGAQSARFIEAMLSEARRADSPVQFVLTLRADFFGQCHRYEELWKLMTRDQYTLPRPDRERLRAVIAKPLALAGISMPPDLTDALIEDSMIADATDEAGRLALLEHALERLWAESKGAAPDSATYAKIGRLRGAIQRHADWVLRERLKTPAERTMAQRIFIELTALGEDTTDTARRVPKARLEALGTHAAAVLQVLAEERLITIGDSTGESVMIIHEALIREWPALREWLDRGWQDILLGREIQLAAEGWKKAGKDPSRLFRGARLEQALKWRTNRRADDGSALEEGESEPWEVDQFLNAGRRRDRQERWLLRGLVASVMALLLVFAVPNLRKFAHDLRRDWSGRENSKDGMRYVWIPPGEFEMGCSDGDPDCLDDESPRHHVSITKGFWMGQTEVTQTAWNRVMRMANPSAYQGPVLPVENVSSDQATQFCESEGMRLPTEAEWEYAARAGSRNARYGPLAEVATATPTERAGSKQPNAWGLYDMLGGVWEWTADRYGPYSSIAQTNPTGAETGNERTLRGGSWYISPRDVRVSYRVRFVPTNRNDSVGFRCAGELR